MKIFISLVFLLQPLFASASEIQLPQITDPGTHLAEVVLHTVDAPLGQFYLKTHILTPLFNQQFAQCVIDSKQKQIIHEQYAMSYLDVAFIVRDSPFMALLHEGARNGWSPANLTPFDMVNWILSGKNTQARAKILEMPILKYIVPQSWFLNGLPISCALLNESIEQKNIQALRVVLKPSSYPFGDFLPSKDQIAYGLEKASLNGWESGVSFLINSIGIIDSVMLGHIETALGHAASNGHFNLIPIFMKKIKHHFDHAGPILVNALRIAATHNHIGFVSTLLDLPYFNHSKQDLIQIASLTTNEQISDMIHMKSIKPRCFCSYF